MLLMKTRKHKRDESLFFWPTQILRTPTKLDLLSVGVEVTMAWRERCLAGSSVSRKAILRMQ